MWMGYRATSDGIKCWALGSLWGLRLEQRSSLNPHSALRGLASLPFPHVHASAVSGSGWPVPTNLLGQGSLFALPRAQPGGPDPEYCVAQPKHSFRRLLSFMKRKSNPGIHALMASSQRLKCHFWGDALPRAGCNLQGNKNLLLLPLLTCGGGPPPDFPYPPPWTPPHPHPYPHHRRPWETKAGLLGFCPSPGWCWCIPAKRTTKEVFFLPLPCGLVPSPLFALGT